MRSDVAIQMVRTHAEGEVGHVIAGGGADRGGIFVIDTCVPMRDPADPWPRGYRIVDTWPACPEKFDRMDKSGDGA